MSNLYDRRRVTVSFEGTDWNGQEFRYERVVDAQKSGDNPRFYSEQVAEAVEVASKEIRKAVEANYGTTA